MRISHQQRQFNRCMKREWLGRSSHFSRSLQLIAVCDEMTRRNEMLARLQQARAYAFGAGAR
jgi:hypothetical protein